VRSSAPWPHLPSSKAIVGAQGISVGGGMERSGTGRQDAAAQAAAGRAGGTLTLAAVPIGQPCDASSRLAAALAAAPVVAAEDTRRLGRPPGPLGGPLAGPGGPYH